VNYIKSWKLFLLEKFEVSADDKPDVKLSKEKLNKLEEQIAEFNLKKPQVEQIYKTYKKKEDIQKELDKLLGEEGEEGEGRNILLVKWVEVVSLKKSIEDLVDQNALDKVKVEEMKSEMRIATSASVITRISNSVKDIGLRIKKNLTDISAKMAEVAKTEAKFKLDMAQFKASFEEMKKKIGQTKPK
jgi:hypothetical protein